MTGWRNWSKECENHGCYWEPGSAAGGLCKVKPNTSWFIRYNRLQKKLNGKLCNLPDDPVEEFGKQIPNPNPNPNPTVHDWRRVATEPRKQEGADCWRYATSSALNALTEDPKHPYNWINIWELMSRFSSCTDGTGDNPGRTLSQIKIAYPDNFGSFNLTTWNITSSYTLGEDQLWGNKGIIQYLLYMKRQKRIDVTNRWAMCVGISATVEQYKAMGYSNKIIYSFPEVFLDDRVSGGHALLIVDIDFDCDIKLEDIHLHILKQNKELYKPYFIIKNSWGTSIGDGGFHRINCDVFAKLITEVCAIDIEPGNYIDRGINIGELNKLWNVPAIIQCGLYIWASSYNDNTRFWAD